MGAGVHVLAGFAQAGRAAPEARSQFPACERYLFIMGKSEKKSKKSPKVEKVGEKPAQPAKVAAKVKEGGAKGEVKKAKKKKSKKEPTPPPPPSSSSSSSVRQPCRISRSAPSLSLIIPFYCLLPGL